MTFEEHPGGLTGPPATFQIGDQLIALLADSGQMR